MKPATAEYAGVWRPVRSTTLWTIAAAFSLALNLVFFDLMPRLIDRDAGRIEYSPYIEKVEVIRIRRPEPPARRKEKKEKPNPRETPKSLLRKKQIYANKPVKHTVDLPFEINPKLPAISGTVPVLPVQTVSLGAPDLKGSYGIGEIDHPLTPLVQVRPMYPMRARRRGIEGWVKVRFIVNEEGRVDDISILESHPRKIFDRPVIRCVSAWRFTPGTVEGVPVNTWVETTIRFDLE
ncbi:MAG: energy transducer TonB [Dehalococcoidales bacterium]|nr:energy transducer TonB [Dehalococcoidales bacterium]